MVIICWAAAVVSPCPSCTSSGLFPCSGPWGMGEATLDTCRVCLACVIDQVSKKWGHVCNWLLFSESAVQVLTAQGSCVTGGCRHISSSMVWLWPSPCWLHQHSPLLTLPSAHSYITICIVWEWPAPPSTGGNSKADQIKVAHSFAIEKHNPLLIITLKCDKCCNRGMNRPLGKQGAGIGWQDFLAGYGKTSEKWNLCPVS